MTPGEYAVRVVSTGFTATEVHLTVQVDNTANGNVALRVGETTTTVEVEATGVQVNTDQATVQGVITNQQIEALFAPGHNAENGRVLQEIEYFEPTAGDEESRCASKTNQCEIPRSAGNDKGTDFPRKDK